MFFCEDTRNEGARSTRTGPGACAGRGHGFHDKKELVYVGKCPKAVVKHQKLLKMENTEHSTVEKEKTNYSHGWGKQPKIRLRKEHRKKMLINENERR